MPAKKKPRRPNRIWWIWNGDWHVTIAKGVADYCRKEGLKVVEYVPAPGDDTMPGYLLVQSDARSIPLPDRSVHCVICSPPYFGLRDYSTGRWEGGADPVCDHAEKNARNDGESFKALSEQYRGGGNKVGETDMLRYRSQCRKCGARRIDRQIGLEASIGEYVDVMVRVFREVKRVLRDDGTLWLNMGDAFAHSSSGGGGAVDIRNDGRNTTPGDKVRGRMAGSNTMIPGLAPKNLLGMPWRIAFALQADGWTLRSDIIWSKCLSGGTVVYAKTQKGEMPTTIKDLVRLDPATVQLWDGKKWNQAVSWTPSPRTGNEIEIELRNGTKIGCTLDHRWPVSWGMGYDLVEARSLKVGDTLASCKLPAPSEPREPAMLPSLDIGWFVGLYLAEGSQSNGTIQISGHVKEVERFERLQQIAQDYDGYCFTAGTGGNSATINVNSPVLLGVIDTYVSGRIASDKHLNPRCWKRDDRFLTAIMAGYLSGDGAKQTEDRWKLGFCDNDQLAADLRTLGARLGFSVRLRRAVHKMGDREFPGWRGTLVYRPEKRHHSDFDIVAIGASRARMFWDIAVEGEPHLFALACGALTHNSNPMPESVTDRPTKSHEYLFLLSKQERYWYDAEAVREKSDGQSGWAKQRERGINTWLYNDTPERIAATGQRIESSTLGDPAGRNMRSVLHISTESYPGSHFATFPRRLVEPCVKAGSSERGCCPRCGAGWTREVEREEIQYRPNSASHRGNAAYDALTGNRGAMGVRTSTLGWHPSCSCPPHAPVPCTILDPFAGSGTTLVVANALGRHAIGLDLSREYLTNQAQRRLTRPHAPHIRPSRAEPALPLFGDLDP